MDIFFKLVFDFFDKLINDYEKKTCDVRFYIEEKNENGMAKGILCVNADPSDTIIFNCVSGPYGKGALPPGKYEIKKPYKLADNGNIDAYMGESYAWVAPITPLFECDRTGLLIHPDGNVEGTRGCIGITENDHDCYIALSELFENSKKITLEVSPS